MAGREGGRERDGRTNLEVLKFKCVSERSECPSQGVICDPGQRSKGKKGVKRDILTLGTKREGL